MDKRYIDFAAGIAAGTGVILFANPATGQLFKITIQDVLDLVSGGSPGGSNKQVQFNNSGSFAGDSNLNWDNTNKRLGIGTSTPAYDIDIQNTFEAVITQRATQNNGIASAYFRNDLNTSVQYGIIGSGRSPVGILRPNEAFVYSETAINCVHSTGFRIGSPASSIPHMSVTGLGTSIGTETQVYNLTILGSAYCYLSLHTSATGISGSRGYFQGIEASGVYFVNYENIPTVFYVNGAEKLRFVPSGAVLINTTTDIPSSLLTINSTDKGALFPRMTTTQKNAISSPAEGLIVYDLTLRKLCIFTSAWEIITSV